MTSIKWIWRGTKSSAVILVVVALAVAGVAGWTFRQMHVDEPIMAGPGVTEVRLLSHWFPGLQNTPGDTKVYILRGQEPGGRVLVMGGNSPNEPAGFVSAVLLVENARMQIGELWVIPRANRPGFTHTSPKEATPQGFTIPTPHGDRHFRFGSRHTNPIFQWPDPVMFIHTLSGQQLAPVEARNLNRTFPGRPDGNLTEQIAYGITQLIRTEGIDLTIDLHEASPEFPNANDMMVHERAMTLAATVVMNLQMEGIDIGLEISPKELRGLTHRELGEYTLAVLTEKPNPSQGRLRGRTDEALIVTGRDRAYVIAALAGRLHVPFDQYGHPLKWRVGRKLTYIREFLAVFSELHPERSLVVTDIPTLIDVTTHGLGKFLLPVN